MNFSASDRQKPNGLLKNSAILSAGVLGANVFNMLFQVVMGRLFSVDEFGLLSSLLGVVNMLMLPLSVVALAITHTVSELDGAGRRGDVRCLLHRCLIRLGGLGLLVNAFIYLFPDALVEWFKMDRVAPLYVFGFVWLGTLIRPVFFASLRGFEMFTAWSWSHLIQSIARLGGGLFLVISVSAYAGWGLLGHGIGVFVGTSIAGTTLWMCLKNEVASGQTIPPLGGYMGQSVAVWLGLAVFLVGDVVLVRRAFPEWSGLYAYAAVLGHLILVVPQSICGALFPKVVKASFTERMVLYRSSAWTTLGAIVLLSLGVVVFGTFLLGLLFGPEAVTDESVRWLRYIALSLIPICYLQYTVQFALAIKQFRWLWMVLVFALVLVGFLEAGLVTSPDGLIGWMAGLALMLAVGIDCRIRRVLARESVA